MEMFRSGFFMDLVSFVFQLPFSCWNRARSCSEDRFGQVSCVFCFHSNYLHENYVIVAFGVSLSLRSSYFEDSPLCRIDLYRVRTSFRFSSDIVFVASERENCETETKDEYLRRQFRRGEEKKRSNPDRYFEEENFLEKTCKISLWAQCKIKSEFWAANFMPIYSIYASKKEQVVKNRILERMKAVSSVQLFDVIVNEYDEFYSKKLISFANGRFPDYIKKRF